MKLEPTLRLDIRYATTNNFVGRAVYREARAFLQRPAAEAVGRAHRSLGKQGLGLMVFDGYRPRSVARAFWEFMPPNQRQFVADPAQGSPHSRGCAVDLTLFRLATGRAVEMPSAYDEWTDRSRQDYSGGTAEARRRRDLLRDAMEAEGFIPAELEWWHYTWQEHDRYPELDVPFFELR